MRKIFYFILLVLLGKVMPLPAGAQAAEWLDFPTLFTPNGDGNNDFFKAYGEGVKDFHLRIYNRQGVLCYETTSWEEARDRGWDGRVGGQLAPVGVYMWLIEGTFVSGQALQDRRGKKHGSFYLQP
jgi:gliding motility-associated-like protein